MQKAEAKSRSETAETHKPRKGEWEAQGLVIAFLGGDFGTCCGRMGYQISHCERFDNSLLLWS